MQGFITDRDFDLVERVFPGIKRFYLETLPRPRTFLELLWRFEGRACGLGRSSKTGYRTRRQKVP
jgi:hypothetical protein